LSALGEGVVRTASQPKWTTGANPQPIKPGGIEIPPQIKVTLKELNFAPYNPNAMTKKERRSLRASLLKHGLVLNLVVQKHSEAYGPMILIGGHQRVDVMREICAEKGWAEPDGVPAVVLDVTDSIAKQLNASLNNVHGDNDPNKLGLMFADVRLDMSEDDILATGFDADDIDELIKSTKPVDITTDVHTSPLKGAHTLAIDFATAAARTEAKVLLKGMAIKERVGDLVLRLAKQAAAARPSQPPPKKKKK
jgi:ParB-like chromosome segregation protein Spo0J